MKKYATSTFLKTLTVLPARFFLLALLLCSNSIRSCATAWTTGTAGDITILSNWTNGTTSPTSFTTPGDTWTINQAMTTSLPAWTVGTPGSTTASVTFVTGGSLTITSSFAITIYGAFIMTDGSVSTSGTGTVTSINVYGNFSTSGPSSITSTALGTGSSSVHLSLPTASGTMLADNTSTVAWSKTNAYVDAGCTAQLDGNFISPLTGAAVTTSGAFGLTVNGTLICPAAYAVTGTGITAGIFKLNAAATLEVANALGINGNITTTGTKTFNTGANYVFNGTAAQVTGSFLPAALVSPDTIAINNSAGVSLSNPLSTTGTLLFASGILYTPGTTTMTVPGTVGAVVGAGATSYVDGTLIKTISGVSSVNYEVGDLDYVPMLLTLDATGTSGSLGVMSTNGLHPSVGTSGLLTTDMANHYWTITNNSAAGPANVNVTATYNLSDIIGGSNATFLTQEYNGSAWLATPLATTNTSSPYTSAENPLIPLATLAGDYIFGSNCTTPAITGPTNVCTASSILLSDAASGGTWGSSNTAIATVNASGDVYGVAAGSATISYTVGCPATVVITVGTLPITGTTTICSGSTSALSDATPGGVWSSSNTSFATVSATGVVYGASAGSANISYTLGSCTPVSIAVTIVTLTAISGTTTVCAGSTTTLSDGTSGGVWSSSNTAVATVTGGGIVHGTSAGSVVISYTLGSCVESTTVTVGTLPITGSATVCAGSTGTLNDATPGGVWSSSNTAVATVSGTGVVYGITAGSTTITYAFGSCTPVTLSVTVVSLTAISGTTTVCSGSTTQLSDGTSGGVWSSSNPAVATVSGTGVVYGVSTGTINISYSIGACSVDIAVTVSGTLGAITGSTAVCLGSTTNLSDATAGGTWSSSNPGVATVSGTGVVGGVSDGTSNITYSAGGCTVDVVATVSGPLSAITGGNTVCTGSTLTLSDSPTGGVWSSNNTAIATVSGTGVVTGVSGGGTTISYSLGGCNVGIPITVGNTLSAITGNTEFCITSPTTLSDATPGGIWSSGNTSVATVSGSVVVHGVSAGTATISYTAGGCSVTYAVTVDPNNGGTITGTDTVCAGSTTTLADAVGGGGVWSSSNTSKATVSGTGIVTGGTTTSTVTVTISYIVTNTCGTYTATTVMHVFPASSCPTGIEPVTQGQGAELKVFPNPNVGTFTMNLASDNNEEVHVVITNIVGEKVSEFITVTNKNTDIRLVPAAGIYLLSASTADGRYVAKVVVE